MLDQALQPARSLSLRRARAATKLRRCDLDQWIWENWDILMFICFRNTLNVPLSNCMQLFHRNPKNADQSAESRCGNWTIGELSHRMQTLLNDHVVQLLCCGRASQFSYDIRWPEYYSSLSPTHMLSFELILLNEAKLMDYLWFWTNIWYIQNQHSKH